MHQHTARRFNVRRVLIAAVSIAGAVTLLLVCQLLSKKNTESLPQLRAGQLVHNCGEFRFPNDSRTLEVSELESGNVSIAIRAESSVVWCIPFTKIPYRTSSQSYIKHQVVVESERDWFGSVDRYNRLWIFYGRWNKQWGQLRELPGGGTRPYAPAVILQGFSFSPSGTLVRGSKLVMRSGDWAGAPTRFLQRVQNATKMEAENCLLVPANAPIFTPAQKIQMKRLLN